MIKYSMAIWMAIVAVVLAAELNVGAAEALVMFGLGALAGLCYAEGRASFKAHEYLERLKKNQKTLDKVNNRW